LAAVATTLFAREQRRAKSRLLPGLTPGYSNNRFAAECVEYRHQGEALRVQYVPRGRQLALWVGEQEFELVRAQCVGAELRFEIGDGVLRRAHVARQRDSWFVQLDGSGFQLAEQPRFPVEDASAAPGACVAPMPGKVVRVEVSVGQQVATGQTLVILEAMKMEHRVLASHSGTLTALNVAEGDQVDAEAVLAVISEADATEAAAS
jgi:biotin carboxyl carrier protein